MSATDGLDLNQLAEARFVGGKWVPFSIRYGYKRIADFARKTEHWSAVPGRLWELIASPKGTP